MTPAWALILNCIFIFTTYQTALAKQLDKIYKGLAVYNKGTGEPLLLMPYPHASAYHPMIKSPLVNIFNDLGYSVLTFDPPGIYASARKAEVTLEEMMDCTNELLDLFNIKGNMIIAGHSQSAFCSLAYAVEFPNRVKKLILTGAVSGWPMVMKTSIHKQFGWFTREKWQLMYRGTRKMLHLSNLYNHKKLDQLVSYHSYYNKANLDSIEISTLDRKKPEPARAKWMVHLRKYNYDYSNRLNEIKAPTLICVGKYDTQTPAQTNMQLKNGIKHSCLKVFDKSGHEPFLEEPEKFKAYLQDWLKK